MNSVVQATCGLVDVYEGVSQKSSTQPAVFGSCTNEDGHFVPSPGLMLSKRYICTSRIKRKGESAVLINAKDCFQTMKIVIIKVMHTSYLAVGLKEVDTLRRLNYHDPGEVSHTVTLLNAFMYDKHVCMVFPSLDPQPLNEIIMKRNLSVNHKLKTIRKITFHLLSALAFLGRNNTIHADLKPENVLLEIASDSSAENLLDSLTVVDFGNAIHHTHTEVSLYYSDFDLQTLPYRAPEVCLGMPFGVEIDMWSLGCLLAELYIGKILFPGATRASVLKGMTQLLGPLPEGMCQRGKFGFESEILALAKNESFGQRTSVLGLMSKMPAIKDYSFASFLSGLLCYSPDQRLTPWQALQHPFMSKEICIGNFLPDSSLNHCLIDKTEYDFHQRISSDIKRMCPSTYDLLKTGTGELQQSNFVSKNVARVEPMDHSRSISIRKNISLAHKHPNHPLLNVTRTLYERKKQVETTTAFDSQNDLKTLVKTPNLLDEIVTETHDLNVISKKRNTPNSKGNFSQMDTTFTKEYNNVRRDRVRRHVTVESELECKTPYVEKKLIGDGNKSTEEEGKCWERKTFNFSKQSLMNKSNSNSADKVQKRSGSKKTVLSTCRHQDNEPPDGEVLETCISCNDLRSHKKIPKNHLKKRNACKVDLNQTFTLSESEICPSNRSERHVSKLDGYLKTNPNSLVKKSIECNSRNHEPILSDFRMEESVIKTCLKKNETDDFHKFDQNDINAEDNYKQTLQEKCVWSENLTDSDKFEYKQKVLLAEGLNVRKSMNSCKFEHSQNRLLEIDSEMIIDQGDLQKDKSLSIDVKFHDTKLESLIDDCDQRDNKTEHNLPQNVSSSHLQLHEKSSVVAKIQHSKFGVENLNQSHEGKRKCCVDVSYGEKVVEMYGKESKQRKADAFSRRNLKKKTNRKENIKRRKLQEQRLKTHKSKRCEYNTRTQPPKNSKRGIFITEKNDRLNEKSDRGKNRMGIDKSVKSKSDTGEDLYEIKKQQKSEKSENGNKIVLERRIRKKKCVRRALKFENSCGDSREKSMKRKRDCEAKAPSCEKKAMVLGLALKQQNSTREKEGIKLKKRLLRESLLRETTENNISDPYDFKVTPAKKRKLSVIEGKSSGKRRCPSMKATTNFCPSKIENSIPNICTIGELVKQKIKQLNVELPSSNDCSRLKDHQSSDRNTFDGVSTTYFPDIRKGTEKIVHSEHEFYPQHRSLHLMEGLKNTDGNYLKDNESGPLSLQQPYALPNIKFKSGVPSAVHRLVQNASNAKPLSKSQSETKNSKVNQNIEYKEFGDHQSTNPLSTNPVFCGKKVNSSVIQPIHKKEYLFTGHESESSDEGDILLFE